jgi:sugar lactone lactonase YvrE
MIYPMSYAFSTGNVGRLFVGKNQLFSIDSSDVTGICTDSSGNIFVTDPVQHIVLKITPAGTIMVYAGKPGESGNNGNVRIKANLARFNAPMGITADASGNVYVADKGNNQIRMITSDGYVTLFAGSPTGTSGFRSGVGSQALFRDPNDVTVNKSGTVFVSDTGNHAVRMIKAGISLVSTVAGNGVAGDGYGIGINARLKSPYSVAADNSGRVFICDSGNHKIKLLDGNFNVLRFSGSGNTGTRVGNADVCEYNDIKFSDVDRSGNLYVVDFRESNSRVLRINQNGVSAVTKDFAYTSEDTYAIGIATRNAVDLNLYITESTYEISNYSSSSSSESSSSSSTEVRSSSSSSSSSSSAYDYLHIFENNEQKVHEDGNIAVYERDPF